MRYGCVCSINNHFINLFKLARQNVTNLQDKYNTGWLYHASFSPTWFERIRKHRGYIDYERNQVKFITEECEDAFYDKYGYDPDEQPQNVKDNCLKHINEDNHWKQFYEKYKKNGIIIVDEDELDAFDDELLKY
jgi:hypothetical protein